MKYGEFSEDAELDSTSLAVADVNTTTDVSITSTAKPSGEAFWLHMMHVWFWASHCYLNFWEWMNKGLFVPQEFSENFLTYRANREPIMNRRRPHAALCFIVAVRLILTWIDQVMESALAISRTNLRRDLIKLKSHSDMITFKCFWIIRRRFGLGWLKCT